jgi:hypothetical protein
MIEDETPEMDQEARLLFAMEPLRMPVIEASRKLLDGLRKASGHAAARLMRHPLGGLNPEVQPLCRGAFSPPSDSDR